MKRLLFTAITALSVTIMSPLVPGWSQAPKENDRHDFSKVTDEEFAKMAAQMNLLETELGTKAQSNAQRADVKQFGKQMVVDHTNASTHLLASALVKRIALPTKLDAKHQAEFDRLSALQGDAFDRAYVQQMVKGHHLATQLYQHEASNGNDSDLKAYAAQILPTVRQHHQKAQQLWKDNFENSR
jgi:putative membrane protein